MDSNSQEILRRVTQNDPSLKNLRIGSSIIFGDGYGEFNSDNSDDYSALGTAIANNTHLESLIVALSDGLPLGVADREFYNGLKSNSSISDLCLGRSNIAGGVGQEILKVYQENNSQLTELNIIGANLQSGGDRVIVDTLRSCRNLQKVVLNSCSITDECLLPIVDAVRELGISMLEGLYLYDNNIGNAGCEAIATLLTDPICNLCVVHLGNNAINNEGATTIANSLTNNNQLLQLYLQGNPIDQSVEDEFSNILCNTSNINSVYSSNHTLETLNLGYDEEEEEYRNGQELESLLDINNDNKSHVAIKKILKYHPNMDMGPLFEWGMEEDCEQTLKALPYIVSWFGRAEVAVADEEGETYRINDTKLSAIFQFAKAMPMLFEGIANTKVDEDKKRKRSDG